MLKNRIDIITVCIARPLFCIRLQNIIHGNESVAEFFHRQGPKTCNRDYLDQRLLEANGCRLQGQLATATSVRFIEINLPLRYPRRLY